ncbi:MAG: YciI-like protein [Bryobacteraceae bacterium]
MHFILFYDLADDYLARRAAFRAEHLALVGRAMERGDIVLAGALADPYDGAVLVFHTASPDPAEAFANADPYVANGLVKSWRVRKWMTITRDGSPTP